MEALQFQLNFYNNANIIVFIAILGLCAKVMKNSLGQSLKDNDESDYQLIHFELFISHSQLIVLIAFVANTVQIFNACLVCIFLGEEYFLFAYTLSSIMNGAALWQTLISLKRTSFRRSKLLQLLNISLFLVPYLIISQEPTFQNFIYGLAYLGLQILGIFLGMAITAIYKNDAFGEYKQEFSDTHDKEYQLSINRRLTNFLKTCLLYGYFPFLCLSRYLKQDNQVFSVEVVLFALISYYQGVIMTYMDSKNLKTNWCQSSNKQAVAQMFYIFIFELFHLHDAQRSAIQMILLFIISKGTASIQQVQLQRYIQEQRKLE